MIASFEKTRLLSETDCRDSNLYSLCTVDCILKSWIERRRLISFGVYDASHSVKHTQDRMESVRVCLKAADSHKVDHVIESIKEKYSIRKPVIDRIEVRKTDRVTTSTRAVHRRCCCCPHIATPHASPR